MTTPTPDFPTIPEHTKVNYSERVAAGEKWLDLHVQALRDGYDDLAAWFKHQHESTSEAPAEPVEAAPVVEAPAAPVAETPAK